MTAGAAPDRLGMIGLGTMGRILARRLLEHGCELAVCNRSADAVAPLRASGAAVAATPQALAERCDVVFTVLPGPEVLSAVAFGPHGLAAAWTDRARSPVICDLSTQEPSALEAIALRAAGHGIALVHAPMAGSVHDATHGTMKFLYGGDHAILARLERAFSAWGPAPALFETLHQAATAKLALNLLVGVMAQGLAEALHLLQRSGIAADRFLDVLAASGLRSPLYQRLGARHLERDGAVRFALAHLRKDIEFCTTNPAWEQHRPVLLNALHGMLQGIAPSELRHDYSHLLRLEMERRASEPDTAAAPARAASAVDHFSENVA